jgi:hypothetical protein
VRAAHGSPYVFLFYGSGPSGVGGGGHA